MPVYFYSVNWYKISHPLIQVPDVINDVSLRFFSSKFSLCIEIFLKETFEEVLDLICPID